jgi:hypothetical protein
MKRRAFMRLSLVLGGAILLPTWSYSKELDLSKIQFSKPANNVQTIIIYLYGGASQLSGNLSNIEEINEASLKKYPSYFRGDSSMTQTTNNCWAEAGGTEMEEMMSSGDMTLFRTCYSAVREQANNKAHGVCTAQNQKGSFDDNNAGVLSNLGQILEANSVVSSNTVMPFVTLEGESNFYATGSTPVNAYLKPIAMDADLNNPYKRDKRNWLFYNNEEKARTSHYSQSDEKGGFDPEFDAMMTNLAQAMNNEGKIKNAFSQRETLVDIIENITKAPTPNLGSSPYPTNSRFAKSVESAIKILKHNNDTKVITLSGSSGLGGWDDHSNSTSYVPRAKVLFQTLKAAMEHLRAEGKINDVSIMVFGEFGRGINLNSAHGWDHGNLQNLYVLGGKSYLNHKGVVGETMVHHTGKVNRIYHRPKSGSYTFEPMSIASTIYKMHGIENPSELTGYPEITPLFS